MLETIKSYLVDLGFSVDKASYNAANKSIGELEKGIGKFAGAAVKGFAKAALAIASFSVAITAATVKMLNGLGNQEVQLEILSRQLWTTQKQAMAFSATLKAMGTNLQNLYLSPTLMKQYQHLIGVAGQMATPGDYNSQIQQIQSIQLQMKQLRLESYYALQWIGYYFIKFMAGPISKVNGLLQKINNAIVKHMPEWTKKVASVMASFFQAGEYIVNALVGVYHWLQKLLSYIPGWAKGIAAAFLLISVSNPFMLIIEGIAALLLLFDDFETYIHGGKSAFPQLWSWLIKIGKAIQGLSVYKSAVQMIVTAFKTFGQILNDTWIFAKKLWSVFQDNGTITRFIAVIKDFGKALGNLFGAIGDVIVAIGQLFGFFTKGNGQSAMVQFFQLIADLAIGAIEIVTAAIDVVAGLARIVIDFLDGNWKDILKVAKSTAQSVGNVFANGAGFGIGGGSSGGGAASSSYYPSTTSSSSVQNVTINAGQSNYISGSSPQGTANAVQMSYNRTLYNIRGFLL